MKYTEAGHEINSGVPARPIERSRSETGDGNLAFIRRTIRNEFSRIAESHNFETFDEANDFDVGDDFQDAPETIYMKEEYLVKPQAAEKIKAPSSGDEAGGDSNRRVKSEIPPRTDGITEGNTDARQDDEKSTAQPQ